MRHQLKSSPLRSHSLLCLVLSVGACASDPDLDETSSETPQPGDAKEPDGSIPPGFALSGGFNFTGPAAPGSAAFSGAPVWDFLVGEPPLDFGTGTYEVSAGNIQYAGDALESLGLLWTDDDGEQYLAVDGIAFFDLVGVEQYEQVTLFVKSTDFALNAPISLDGTDRVALFASGPADENEPEVLAAAVTGTVTFTAGGAADGSVIDGSLVSATLEADFGPIEWTPEGEEGP